MPAFARWVGLRMVVVPEAVYCEMSSGDVHFADHVLEELETGFRRGF